MLEHRLAQLAAAATFVLLIIGGTVNPTGSSLACPEPTLVCHGQLFPPMVGGVFYEHGHRLAAMTVGFLQIALTVALLRRRPGLGKVGLVLLAMVLAQGTLGALTVYYKLPWFVSTGHLVLGMSYFASLVWVAFGTAPTRWEAERARAARSQGIAAARPWIVLACAAIMVQLLLGALVRHLGAAMVCLGMPECTRGGNWWPDTAVQHLHMIHRGFGVLVAIVTTVAAISVWRHAQAWPALRRLAVMAPVLVTLQIVLGIYTVLTLRSVPVAVGHFAGAAALWALWSSMLWMTRPAPISVLATEPMMDAAIGARA